MFPKNIKFVSTPSLLQQAVESLPEPKGKVRRSVSKDNALRSKASADRDGSASSVEVKTGDAQVDTCIGERTRAPSFTGKSSCDRCHITGKHGRSDVDGCLVTLLEKRRV